MVMICLGNTVHKMTQYIDDMNTSSLFVATFISNIISTTATAILQVRLVHRLPPVALMFLKPKQINTKITGILLTIVPCDMAYNITHIIFYGV